MFTGFHCHFFIVINKNPQRGWFMAWFFFFFFFFFLTFYFLFYTLPFTLTSVWMEVTIEGNMLGASTEKLIHSSVPSGILEKCSKHAKCSIFPNLTGIDYHSRHSSFKVVL